MDDCGIVGIQTHDLFSTAHLRNPATVSLMAYPYLLVRLLSLNQSQIDTFGLLSIWFVLLFSRHE